MGSIFVIKVSMGDGKSCDKSYHKDFISARDKAMKIIWMEPFIQEFKFEDESPINAWIYKENLQDWVRV